MAKVPQRFGPAALPQVPPEQEVYFAMAAADMDKRGALFETEPTPFDWAKAQATDLYETGKKMIGMDDGKYEPFKNTEAVRDRAVRANSIKENR